MRLDARIFEMGLAESRTKAAELIKKGAVKINGTVVIKPSYPMFDEDRIEIDSGAVCKYVSRGGLKLEHALEYFGVDPKDKVCADIGASTGGFTDCLLQHGASKIYSIDSGTDQLHAKLRSDKRVVSIENCNARYITHDIINEKCDLVVMDVSFISQTKLYDSVLNIIVDNGSFISLIKPQFEVGKGGLGKGGIVTDTLLRESAVKNVIAFAEKMGMKCNGVIPSPIKGGDGNVEYLAYFTVFRRC